MLSHDPFCDRFFSGVKKYKKIMLFFQDVSVDCDESKSQCEQTAPFFCVSSKQWHPGALSFIPVVVKAM